MKRSLCAAALLAGLGLAAATIPAAAQRVGEANCIAPINFDSWRALDDKTVILTSRTRRDYKVSLAPGCFDLDFAMRIGIKSFSTSRLQCISRGDFLTVPRDAGFPGERCMITKVEAYTPDMAHADAVAKAMSKAPR